MREKRVKSRETDGWNESKTKSDGKDIEKDDNQSRQRLISSDEIREQNE